MISQVQEQYPNAKMFATTLRQVISANEHLWGAILLADGKWYVEEPRKIQVLDRIGGGDGFSGGLLYGVLNGWEAEKCLQFGWASGVMAASSLNDYAEPADEKQVWDIYKGQRPRAAMTSKQRCEVMWPPKVGRIDRQHCFPFQIEPACAGLRFGLNNRRYDFEESRYWPHWPCRHG